jgi:ABC-type enterochelin transport system permease subunit|tara:strand:+ start:237 stop:455 length:219 start_codon:yes stop_codon:yes gene_type:complete
MWKSITDAISNVTTVAVSLIGLSVALEVVFGGQVPFLSLGVINNISGIVADLGSQGLIGLITLGILWALWKK